MPEEERTARSPVLRILDANLNRLREALRVIEEYARFVDSSEDLSVALKTARHSLEEIDRELGHDLLLASRDVTADPLAQGTRPEELRRGAIRDVVCASFKRGQEAARVIEEYVKVTPRADLSDRAKTLRFALYALEKQFMEKMAREQAR